MIRGGELLNGLEFQSGRFRLKGIVELTTRILLVGWWAAVMAAGWVQAEGEKKPRAAVVNIQELFRNYYKTGETQDEISQERAEIQKDHNDMENRLRSLDAGLRRIAARLQAPDLQPLEKAALERERGLRFQERERFNRERRSVVERRNNELNQKMVIRMRRLLEEIRKVVAEQAESEGYDLVFDTEGLNSTQVPVLLYAKDATDITPIILKELNKEAPDGH